MTTDPVLLDRGAAARLTLNRPDAGNVLDDAGLASLANALQEVASDETCRVLVIGGAGEAFCRGREGRSANLGASPSAYARRASLEKITAVNTALHAVSAVTIAAVNGDALGFGCGLALQCDFTLAVEEATFGFPEIDSGLPPTLVMSYLGRYVPRKRAADLVLTGRRLVAREAEAIGLLTRVVSREQLEGEVASLVDLLLAKDPLALRTAKQFLAEASDLTPEQASRYGLNLLAVTLSARQSQ